MATTTIVSITDDLDGSKDAKTYEITYDGTTYTIDLAKKNKTALDKALKPFLEVATKGSGRGRRRSTTGRRSSRSAVSEDLGAIRAWAKANGHQIADRGRISQAVRDAYHSAK